MTTAKLTTLVNFNSTDGADLDGGLIADAAGNLFGTCGGCRGSIFEIARIGAGYASLPTILARFSGYAMSGLTVDAKGDIFGATTGNGINGDGTVFEVAKTSAGYAPPTVLVSFNPAEGIGPKGGLTTDSEGNLFGATESGTVFEIAKTSSGYANAPTVLCNGLLIGSNSSLFLDAAGDLFGTTPARGAQNKGAVFEIAKTSGGYASTPTVLASFDGADGAEPLAGLTSDAAGNLFGATYQGGAHNIGGVFEIAKTATGYASTPTLLASFNGSGEYLFTNGGLIADAAGDLFGMTVEGGAHRMGAVFEIAKTSEGYASTPTVLTSFNGANGDFGLGGLIADAAGDLFGATSFGGSNGDGTAFELSDVGFKVTIPTGGIDLASVGYKSSYEAVWQPATNLLRIIDTANSEEVVATLSIAGTLTGGLIALSSDGTGAEVSFTPNSLVSVAPVEATGIVITIKTSP
jgi:hypothetical protein